jgi:hypothetical protein
VLCDALDTTDCCPVTDTLPACATRSCPPQWSLNTDITAVWAFWDAKPAFSAWEGNLKKLYMSAAALVAGWVSVCGGVGGVSVKGVCTWMRQPTTDTHLHSCCCLSLSITQIMTVIFALIWIGFVLDAEADEEPAAAGAAPITNDVEASRKN